MERTSSKLSYYHSPFLVSLHGATAWLLANNRWQLRDKKDKIFLVSLIYQVVFQVARKSTSIASGLHLLLLQ